MSQNLSLIDGLEIVRVKVCHESVLCDLFQAIGKGSENTYFHPHLFSDEVARHIAKYTGKNLYYLVMLSGRALGYGMLRGWDEGYDEPSLGIYVVPDERGKGIANLLIAHMHLAARFRGASHIRLKVYPQNIKAKSLYERLGYVFGPTLTTDGQLLGRITLN